MHVLKFRNPHEPDEEECPCGNDEDAVLAGSVMEVQIVKPLIMDFNDGRSKGDLELWWCADRVMQRLAGVLSSKGRDTWTSQETLEDILDVGEDEIAILLLLRSLQIQVTEHGGVVLQVSIVDYKIRSSMFGWLLLKQNDHTHGLVFYNPFTNDLRKLPKAEYNQFESLCFSAPPTSVDCMVVGFTWGWDAHIHFVNHEPSWRPVSHGQRPIDSLTFCWTVEI
ncbi:hypothetical protein Tco_1404177 [Tanacetum coccineum]